MTEGKEILLGFSGGVDSSLAAALLKDEGYRVLALTFKMDSRKPEAEDARVERAAKVAAQLGVLHRVEDAREDFRAWVLAPAWEQYQRGRTPNPCARCNPGFKFARMQAAAEALGIEALASGHYARIRNTPSGPQLLRALDRGKDQSYFLFDLPTEILARTHFPLGEMNKAAVRRRAARLGLANASQSESQDVCIALAGERFGELLRELFDGQARPGPVVDPAGRVLGRHAGLHRYTIGQRRGLGLALGRPAWICAIETESARLVVSTDPADLHRDALETEDTRWAQAQASGQDLPARVQIRSQHQAASAQLKPGDGGRCRVVFDQPQRAVAPGQAAVFYDLADEALLGGGWIR